MAKPPRPLWEDIFAFAPNRDTLGGTAYFIVDKSGNILVDCPSWEGANQQFLIQEGGVRWLFLTHRGAMGKKVRQMQENLGCEVVIQEQEAYLLPNVKVTTFEQEISLGDNALALWTCGHSPGSACLYHRAHGGILFTGRHLLPNQQAKPVPLHTEKTFHWRRQLASVRKLGDRFSADTLSYICPGANTGYLRGQGFISDAYNSLRELRFMATDD
jgi:glyoxylase-like metal-dependent hydrolase (beta-lactamase superfamily II)